MVMVDGGQQGTERSLGAKKILIGAGAEILRKTEKNEP